MTKMRDLSGQVFDSWTVQNEYIIENKRTKWRCVCRCGTEKYVDTQNLISGKSKSCGCHAVATSKKRINDLTAQTFGWLYVIRRADENLHGRVSWICRCLRCANECVMTGHQLTRGNTVSCGCFRDSKKTSIVPGQRFDMLTAQYTVGKRNGKGSLIWHCTCECGGEADVSQSNLLSHTTKSCGCMKKEAAVNMHSSLHFVDGTCLEFLQRKMRSDNTSGYTGVYQLKNGKYRAGIGFKGKQHSLGTYDSLNDAVMVRNQAKNALHIDFLGQ